MSELVLNAPVAEPVKMRDELRKTLSVFPLFLPLVITSYIAYLADIAVLSYMLFYVAILVFCLPSWRIGILTFLAWFLYVGTLRKWFFPVAHKALYFTPHFFVLSSFLSFLLQNGMSWEKYRLKGFYNIYIALLVYSFFSMLIALKSHPYVGVVGFFMHFSFLPLVYMLPALFEEFEDIRKFIRYVICLTLLPFAIGFMQYNEPYDSWWNKTYVGEATALSDDYTVRISSTFTFGGAYSQYLVFIFPLLIWCFFTAKKRGELIFICGVIVMAAFNIFFCNSRSATMPCLLMILLVGLGSLVSGRGYVLRFLSMVGLGVIFYFVCMKYFVTIETDPLGMSMERVFSTNTVERLSDGIFFPTVTSFYGFFGNGIGSQCQGVSGLVADSIIAAQMHGAIESSVDKAIAEVGWFGMVLNFAVALSLVPVVIFRLHRFRSRESKLLFFLLVIAVGVYSFTLSFMHSYVSNAYFHLSIGLLASMFYLEERVREKHEQDEAAAS